MGTYLIVLTFGEDQLIGDGRNGGRFIDFITNDGKDGKGGLGKKVK
mgnify:CR=1 FL=1